MKKSTRRASRVHRARRAAQKPKASRKLEALRKIIGSDKTIAPRKLPALYIGRFQPFHLGHLDAIKQILRKEKSIIIAIGSAQYSHTPENPFTADERRQMIKAALKEAKIPASKYKIFPVPNIESFPKWPKHVDKTLPPYGTVYTGSKIVKNLYKKYGCHEIKPIKFNLKINATLIREKIRKNKNWRELIPASVAKLIEKFGVERV